MVPMALNNKDKSILRKRAELGARQLDRYAPGWANLIDLDNLQMSSCEACICGQLAHKTAMENIVALSEGQDFTSYGSFARGLTRKIGLKSDWTEMAERYGFCSTSDIHAHSVYQFQHLEKVWQRLVRNRQRNVT